MQRLCTCSCATPFGIDIVGITELVALIGAVVGGLAARSRKIEAERLNEQLRKINMQLRQQARAGTIYAPGLSYAPASSSMTVQTSGTGAGGGDGGQGGTATLTKPAPVRFCVLTCKRMRCPSARADTGGCIGRQRHKQASEAVCQGR